MRIGLFSYHVIPRVRPGADPGRTGGSIQCLKGDPGPSSLTQLEAAALVTEQVLETASLLEGRLRFELLLGLSLQPVHTRIFTGAADQVRALRAFVRAALAGHPTTGDVVQAASELAANAILHSASGHDGGMFLVHVTEITSDCVGLIITDQGGADWPQLRPADLDADSGRGLRVVASVACWLAATAGENTARSVIALIAADADEQAVTPTTAVTSRWLRFARREGRPGR